jgi:hypothetical protein
MKNIYVYFILVLCLHSITSIAQQFDCTPDPNLRTRVISSEVPNTYTAYLVLYRGKRTNLGTGMLIHPRVLLTAGHNTAFFFFSKAFPFIISKVHDVDMYFGSIDAKNYVAQKSVKLKKGRTKFFNNGYWWFSKIKDDYSIIILPDSSVYKALGGCYKIAPISSQGQLGKTITLTGSPKDKPEHEIWQESTNNFQVVNNNVLRYDLFTLPRNSGSPIWIGPSGQPQAVGVHSRSYGSCNAAVLINDAVYKRISRWCSSVGIVL